MTQTNLTQDEKNERDQELEDLRAILKTKEGQRFFRRFFSRAYLFRTPFTGNSRTFFNCGVQNLGFDIWGDVLEADPETAAKLMIRTMQSDDKGVDDGSSTSE